MFKKPAGSLSRRYKADSQGETPGNKKINGGMKNEKNLE
jgi:hypothetical protein